MSSAHDCDGTKKYWVGRFIQGFLLFVPCFKVISFAVLPVGAILISESLKCWFLEYGS